MALLFFAGGAQRAFGAGDTSTTLGVLISLPYAVLLAYAIVRFFIAGKRIPVAGAMRAITYVGLLIVYPFFSVHSPVLVGAALVVSVLVILGLSESTVAGIVRGMFAKAHADGQTIGGRS